MGSRIMHLIISNQIANKIPIPDKQSFLIDGVAPDAVSPKDLSHFYSGNHADYTRTIDYEGFLQKYQSNQNSAYILGYYSHLIADELWLSGFYLPWLKNRMEANQDIHQLYHNDFRLLNGKLLAHYDLTANVLNELVINSSIIDLDEVKVKEVKAFLPYLIEDCQYDKKELDEKLNVFTIEQIIGYIETSVEKAIFHLNALIK
ncbi:hydrolase [Fredinandcohnia quinoae]|uniref:Hydrolase n=1 Tax=Fredinandcohnia quinoae TaxID=2918902 RepID=A0AAW5DZB5_9BACI|nr:hydrolase [Fredinandcohnia sp. SECRCQ15]MCH1624365.1 hydrolase [Fredinandcohnia sp. SECRCQ15]